MQSVWMSRICTTVQRRPEIHYSVRLALLWPVWSKTQVSNDTKYGLLPFSLSSTACWCCGERWRRVCGNAIGHMCYSAVFIISWSRLRGMTPNYLQSFYIFWFHFCVRSSAIAKKLKEECFALVFGINTLFALILQSSLTFVVIAILQFDIRTQYQIYGCWFLVLATVFGTIFGTRSLLKR